MAALSGPLAGGRAERLTVPLNGFLAPTGALALAGGCSRVAADRIEIEGFRPGRSALDQIGRASRRDKGCQYVELPGVAVTLKNNTTRLDQYTNTTSPTTPKKHSKT